MLSSVGVPLSSRSRLSGGASTCSGGEGPGGDCAPEETHAEVERGARVETLLSGGMAQR